MNEHTDACRLEVLNPRGDIIPPPTLAPSPRVRELTGKKIGIYWIQKAGGDNFLDNVDALLKEKFPTVEILRYMGPFDLGDAMAESLSKACDLFIYGVGD